MATERNDKPYPEHPVFAQLKKYEEFYRDLSLSVLPFITPGTKSVFNIDSYVYSSTQGTLESISHILSNGRISDAYALLRRYYDSAVINIYSNLYLKNNFSLECFVVEEIDGWLKGTKQLPPYGAMLKYIEADAKMATIVRLLPSATYKSIRDRCNDYTHYNFFKNVLFNDNQVYIGDRTAVLGILSKDLEDIFILHLAYLFFLNDHYLTSSDYLDHLECGLTPPEGSQYYVAPFAQEIFDSVIKHSRKDIAEAIKANTAMTLE